MNLNIILVLVGVTLLSAIAVYAVRLARYSLGPECPACRSRDVHEVEGGYNCRVCGESFH